LTEVTTPAGKPFYLLNLPYYLASETKNYIAWLKNEGRHHVSVLKTAATQSQPPPTSPDR